MTMMETWVMRSKRAGVGVMDSISWFVLTWRGSLVCKVLLMPNDMRKAH